jgi:spermidine/putrescine transport system substrate-binding protein
MSTSERQLIDKMAREVGLSRREFLRRAAFVVGGLTASSVLAACGPAAAPAVEQVQEVEEVMESTEGGKEAVANELNLWAWSIYAPPSAIESFQEEMDTTVHVTYYFGNSELLAKIQAGGANADIIMPSHYRLKQYTDQNLIQTIDESKIPNFENLYDSVKNLDYMFHDGKRISIPYVFGVTGLVYNADEITEPVTSWEIAWDPKYKGRIVMEDTESWIYAAAMVLGYRLDELTEDTDAKLEQIKAKMIEQKPLLLKLYHGLEEIRTLLVSGDALIAHTDAGVAWGLQKDGFNIQVVVPQEGASGWQDQFVIPAEAQHLDLAYAWINHMLDPQVAADLTVETGYLSVVEAAASLLPDDIKNIVKHSDEELARVQWTPDFPEEVFAKFAKVMEEVKAA